MAVNFIETDGFEQRELIRNNWNMLGYEYWCTREMIEMWKHPVTGHVAEMTTY